MAKTLKDLNKIAATHGLELVKGNGYFYWIGTTEEMSLRCAGLFSTSVYTCHFNQGSFEYWLNELEVIRKLLSDNEEEFCKPIDYTFKINK